MIKHLLANHVERSGAQPEAAIVPPQQSQSQIHKCKTCGRMFVTLDKLNVHEENVASELDLSELEITVDEIVTDAMNEQTESNEHEIDSNRFIDLTHLNIDLTGVAFKNGYQMTPQVDSCLGK